MEGFSQITSPVFVLWMIAVLRVADGGITWTKPPPDYTPNSPDANDERSPTKRQIIKGSINEKLIWNFTISGENFWRVQLSFGNPSEEIGQKDSSSVILFDRNNFQQRFSISADEPATLIILNVTEAEGGEYTCTLFTLLSSVARIWKDRIQVEVVEEAKITGDSGSQTGCEGSSVILFCNVTGDPAPNITWTRVWENGSDSEVLQHDTRTDFVLNNRSDTGTYRCVVYNGVGRPSNRTLNVSVDYSPSIEQLSNQTAIEGQNVPLSCKASGKPSPMVRWRSAGGNLLEEGSNTTLSNILRNQSGEYICEASNQCGNTSERLFILVQYKPENVQLQTSPQAQVCEGDIMMFNCSADAVPDVHTYQLFENDTFLENSTTGEFHKNMSSRGVFSYKCVAINDVGSANNSNSLITVNFSPVIQPLSNAVHVEGTTFSLVCTAPGSPVPTVTWISVQTGSRTVGKTLNFTNVDRAQDGEYTCEATNRCGNDSKSTLVIVHYAPNILSISGNKTRDEDDVVTLNCTADSKPAVNITWIKVSGGSTVSFPLTITGKQDEGFYRCTADNGVGSPASKDVFITVANFHPFNTQVMTTLLNNATVVNETFNVTCTAEANPPAEYMLYKDGVFLSNLTTSQTVLVTSVTERISQVRFKCIPFNRFGNGSESEITIAVHYHPDDVTLKTNVSGGIACAGDMIHLNCTADASPPATFVLYENEVMIDEVMPGVWVRPVAFVRDSVHYRCVANNSVDSGSSNNVTLTVHVAASIEPIALTQTVTEGQSLSVYCNASGNPSPMVSWTRIGTSQIFNENVLNFTSINRTDADTYTCEATNGCGNATRMTTIVVHYGPENMKLTTNLTDPQTCHGTLVAFNCTAQGNPEVSLALYQNGVMLSEVSQGFWIEMLTTAGDLGFSCIANNSAGTDTRNSSVTVNVAASIVGISASLTVREGENVTLYCNVSGSPEPNVTWTNMSNSESSSDKRLFVEAISRYQAGVYKCNASNDCGSDSRTSTVTVLYKPENVKLTTNATGNSNTCDGAVVRFTCTADGFPAPSYTLYRDNVMVSEAQVSSGLWILTMSVGESLQYQCKANNSEGTTASDNVTLTVFVGPSLTATLDNSEVVEGENVSLYCNVSGNPTPNITWTTVGNVEKMENPLLIPYIQRDQAGVYTCSAINDCGDITESLTVTVRHRPVITNLQNITVTRGENRTLVCNATGNPPPTVSWTKTSSGETRTNNTWYIENASGNDAGEYKCEASNSVGNDSDTLHVAVEYKPQNTMLVSNLTGMEVCSGAVGNFTCTADARPGIHTYQLKQNDTVIRQNNGGIWSIELVDEGTYLYSCVANNSVGSVMSSSLQIIVNSAPSVVSWPEQQDQQEWIVGESRDLACMVTGKPMPSVSWTKNGERLTNNITLVFPNVTISDQGVYVCEASNICGNRTKSFNITVFADKCKGDCDQLPEKQCERFDSRYICTCPIGKKGDNCKQIDEKGETIQTNFKIENVAWDPVYQDLENDRTKNLTTEITQLMNETFPSLNNSKVQSLSEGSVAVYIEMTFDMVVGKSQVETALKQAVGNGTLGRFVITNIGTVPTAATSRPTRKCGSFWEGDNCDKVKSMWLALIVVGALVVIAVILAMIAFCMHKKGKREGSVSIEGDPRKEENGFRNGNKVAGPYARDNIAYHGDGYRSNSNLSDVNINSTPMVTFSTSQQPQGNNGIHLDDPRASKRAEPGDGTYADLGDFSQKQPAPRTEPVAPVVRPPAYEETQYAEITQFMKGPDNSDQKEQEEEKGIKGEEELTAGIKPGGPDSDNVKSTEEPQEAMEIVITDF